MPTHAELSSKLLADAATFFKALGEQNPELTEQMAENCNVFQQMAALLAQHPEGNIDDKSHGELAGQLLKDAANFFVALADQNEPLKEQMEENAKVYLHLAELVASAPLGIME